MRPVCPNCSGYAKGKFPKLIPSGYPEPHQYQCPCDCRDTEGENKGKKKYFDEHGNCHYLSDKKEKEEPYDGGNPGQHHTKYWYPSLNKRR